MVAGDSQCSRDEELSTVVHAGHTKVDKKRKEEWVEYVQVMKVRDQ